jgi:hypothetical protein
MHVEQLSWRKHAGWQFAADHSADVDLVLYFGSRQMLACGTRYRELVAMFPHSHIVGCSTGGQILGDEIADEHIVAVLVRFAAAKVRVIGQPIADPGQSRACGEAIGRALRADDLAGIFVLSDGLNVNGSELVAGMSTVVGEAVPVTGGLAGDGADFNESLVGADCAPGSRMIAAVGFYGSTVRFGSGSAGGWDVFGPRRRVTRSCGNILYELDNSPALDLYERYLGAEEAGGLPGTALLFPLQVRDPAKPDHEIVRTVLSVDREARSMTFAGDVPQGWQARLMRGDFDHLAAGAADAARQARRGLGELGAANEGRALAVLVSYIGHRLLMGQQTTDEVEAAGAELGEGVARIGFYSYGEISPHAASGVCELHNQTMTITTIAEAVD